MRGKESACPRGVTGSESDHQRGGSPYGSSHEVAILLEPCRLDVFLSGKSGISRNQIQNLISDGKVLLNGKKVKKNIRVKQDDLIKITASPTFTQKINPENILLDVVYQDEDIVVINKIAGMVVHPAGRIRTGTLVNALLFHFKTLSSLGGSERPGLVHRLDRDTSGVLVVAKTNPAHTSLVQQFRNRKVKKKYIALVYGEVKEEGNIETFFGRHPRVRKKMSTWGGLDKGKKAITEIRILEKFENSTLLEVFPKTGRTHQIRVHLAYIGHPVMGDKVYGKNTDFRLQTSDFRIERQMLHAQSIGFLHPRTGKYMEFSAPIPEDMEQVINILQTSDFRLQTSD